MGKERLDKIIASVGSYSRSDAKKLIKAGKVSVGSVTVSSPEMKCDPAVERIMINGILLQYSQNIFLMMNKPAGVLTATKDGYAKTVLDLLPAEYRNREVFPVGRLDKDTEGLLLITDDGLLAHRLLSPKYHVEKEYLVRIEGTLSETDVQKFQDWIILADGFQCMAAKLVILSEQKTDNTDTTDALITIQEGKYHQIKRMFGILEKPVIYLKRLRMGPIRLDDSLEPGGFRLLTEEEIGILKSAAERKDPEWELSDHE